MVRPEIRDWLKEAESDLKHAKICLKLESYNWACFAAQQSAEKALKAFIMAFSRKRPLHTHDLIKLFSEAEGKLKLAYETTEHLGELSSYYTLARYPNAGLTRPSVGISKTQTERAIATSEKVLRAVKHAFKRLEQG
ncbi:MAG: HEPN domain-containing protein [Candidatus Bathyarchaeia archaeon]